MFGLSKLYTYLIACGLAVVFIGGTYYKGYSSGKASQIAVYQVQQAKAVALALDTQSRALASEYQAQLALAEKEKAVAISLIQKEVKSKLLSQKSIVLNNKVCVLPKAEIIELNEILELNDEI